MFLIKGFIVRVERKRKKASDKAEIYVDKSLARILRIPVKIIVSSSLAKISLSNQEKSLFKVSCTFTHNSGMFGLTLMTIKWHKIKLNVKNDEKGEHVVLKEEREREYQKNRRSS